MESPQKVPEYLSYNDYVKFKKQLDQALNNNDNEGFNKIIRTMSGVPDSENFRSNILTKLHNVLRNDPAYIDGKGISYCRYVNFWLNGEVRKKGYEEYQKYFKVFQDFSQQYVNLKQSNYTNSCKEYIDNMEEDVYIGMKFLYEYYQLYDEISSGYFWRTYNHCENLLSKIFNYNHSIEVYYDKNRDLYNKISPYAKLIEEMIKQPPKKCDGNLTFRIPPKFLKDEEIRLQKEEAEKQKIQQEAERKRIQEEEDRKRTQRIQQELESRNIMQPVATNYGVQREGLHEAEPQLLAQFGHSRETDNLESPQPSRALTYRWGLENSGRLEHLKEQVSGQPYEDQLDTGVLKPENEDTNTDGSLLKSLRLPSAITEVLGSVDPVPVVGVSGGMGALFLLFRYTPVGAFFRGGRGRVHRIPRSFNGTFPGGFPGYEDYDGRYIGYSPMSMNPLAE